MLDNPPAHYMFDRVAGSQSFIAASQYALFGNMKMIRIIKLLGIVVGFIGIGLNALNLAGFFVDREKHAFAELVMSSVQPVPRTAPGFDVFLRDFPPPSGVVPEQVTHIGDKMLRWDTSPAESLAVVYMVNGDRTSAVARLDEVREWGNATIYGRVSLVVIIVGWFTSAATFFVEFVREKRAHAGSLSSTVQSPPL